MTEEKINSSLWNYLLAGLTFIALFVLFYGPLRKIAEICWTDDDYSHGLLLPLVALYMVWDQRDRILQKIRSAKTNPDSVRGEKSLFVAEILLLGGLLMLFLGRASGIDYASWIGFFPAVIGAVHLLFGRTAALCFAPPILLLVMAKPLPDSMVVRLFWPLQVLAARTSKLVLEVLDVPVRMVGNIIEIPAMKLLVEEACSGMRSVMALLTLALIVLYFIKLRWVSKIALILTSVGVAIILNIFRVGLTGVLAHFYDPKTATGFFHTFSGLIVFIVGLPILYYAGVGLTKLEGKRSENNADISQEENG